MAHPVKPARASLLFAATLAVSPAAAHQDPRGDIHPSVVVENGNFAIYFQSNRPVDDEDDFFVTRPSYRVVYSPSGELLAPRHPVQKLPELPTDAPGVYGTVLQVGEERLVFPRELLRDKPSYFLEVAGRRQRRRLAWPDELKLTDIGDIQADAQRIVFAATTGEDALSLFAFDRARFAPPIVVPLGRAATIYQFAVASNLVHARGRYWLGWMRQTQDAVHSMLTSWQHDEKDAVHTVLNLPADGNTGLSLAVTDEWLCLAYHCPVENSESRIITHFQKLP